MKQRISSALLNLMLKKSYADITITDIVNKAEIARASFYRNFGGIADVLDFIVDELFEKMAENILPVIKSNSKIRWRLFLREHFEKVEKRKNEVYGIRNQNLSVIFSRMDQRVTMYEQTLGNLSVREKYIVGAKLGLLMGVTKRWINGGMKESDDEMIDFLVSVIMF